jgi:hypothetical protein
MDRNHQRTVLFDKMIGSGYLNCSPQFQRANIQRRRGHGWTYIPFFACNQARVAGDEGRCHLAWRVGSWE